PQRRRGTVLKTSAGSGDCVDGRRTAIDRHHAWLQDSGELMARRQRAMRAEVLAALRARVDPRVALAPGGVSELSDLIDRVARRELTPRRAIANLAARLAAP